MPIPGWLTGRGCSMSSATSRGRVGRASATRGDSQPHSGVTMMPATLPVLTQVAREAGTCSCLLEGPLAGSRRSSPTPAFLLAKASTCSFPQLRQRRVFCVSYKCRWWVESLLPGADPCRQSASLGYTQQPGLTLPYEADLGKVPLCAR